MTYTRRQASLLADATHRIRGDGPIPSTTDPREAQRVFDREARRSMLSLFRGKP